MKEKQPKPYLAYLIAIIIMLIGFLTFSGCKAPHYRYSYKKEMWVNTKDSTDTYQGYAPNKLY